MYRSMLLIHEVGFVSTHSDLQELMQTIKELILNQDIMCDFLLFQ